MTNLSSMRRGQLGFTIVEALIALVVMGFGMLSLAGMQASISRNADVAKQRTEAVRLAQEKIENIRSFTGIAGTTTANDNTNVSLVNWNALVGGNDTVSTNATYARVWTIGGASTDLSRALTVAVSWEDRVGETQTISLSTVLSKTDPRDSGFLGFPLPQNTNLKRPKNRNLDIPIPAIDLGNGNSTVKFGTAGQYIQFANITGDIVSICTPSGLSGSPTSAAIIAALTDANTSNCTSINGYIVAGYVSKDSSVSNSDWTAIQSNLDVNTSGITRNAAGATAISCQFGDAVNQNSGASIADFKYYLCVIPLATPNPALTANGPYNWSGKILLSGPAAWRVSGSKYFVCRYQYATTGTLTNANQRNVQPYDKVNLSIDQQNYVVATAANGTSSTAPTCPSDMTTTDVSTGAPISTGVLHQDCRSASNTANYAIDCPLTGAVTTYTVTYNANGATSGSAPTDPVSPYSDGSTVTVLGNTGAMAKTGGFSFGGWNTSANGTGADYASASTFTIAGNTTLYAKWSTAPTYTMTYNANNGTGAVADSNSPYTSGSNVTILPGSSLTRSGFSFANWNTLANGSGTSYAAGATLTNIGGNTTLYAQWATLPTYAVTYNINGGTGTVPTDSTAYVAGSNVTVLSASLSRPGYSFNGWNTAADGSGTARAVGTNFSISGNTTLYVAWSQIALAAPVPGWSGTGLETRTLSWIAPRGATGYLVRTCSSPDNNNLTTCTPGGSASQTGFTLSVNVPSRKETVCYQIVSTGSPFANSANSSRKCIYLNASGNTVDVN